jgi:hypothetical protein
MEGGAVEHIIERAPPKDHPSQICFNLVQRFQRRRFKCGSNFNCSYMAKSSLTYDLGFSVKFCFQLIYTDYANWAYFDKRSHLNILLWNPGHNIERDPPKDHPCQVWFNLVQRFQRRIFKCESLRRTTTDAKGWQKLTWPCCFSLSQN